MSKDVFMIGQHSNYIADYCLNFHCVRQCADAGYHLSLGQVMQAYLSSRWRTQQNLGTGLQQLQGTVSGLDQSQDRDALLQDHYNTFCMPLRFPYQPHDGDQVCVLCLCVQWISRLFASVPICSFVCQVSEVSAKCEMRCELETRFKQIQSRLKAESQETEEVAYVTQASTPHSFVRLLYPPALLNSSYPMEMMESILSSSKDLKISL